MMLQFSPLFIRIDYGFYKLNKIKINNNKLKLISVIDLESSTFKKEDCTPQKNRNTYVEINKKGSIFKTLPYQRPLRVISAGSYGVVYKKVVYPIIKTFEELEGIRKEIEID